MKSEAFLTVTLALLLTAAPAMAQQKQSAEPTTFVADKALAGTGKKVWAARACTGCHTIGKGRLIGPDLNGVLQRRPIAWLKKWLHDPEAMLASDSVAMSLLDEYKIRMPNLNLSAAEIEALLNYVASESKPKKK